MNVFLKLLRKGVDADIRNLKKEEVRFLRRLDKARKRNASAEKIALAVDFAGSLQSKLRKEVRRKARALHLANAYLLGHAYSEIERFTYTPHLIQWDLIEQTIRDNSPLNMADEMQLFSEWKFDALDYIELSRS